MKLKRVGLNLYPLRREKTELLITSAHDAPIISDMYHFQTRFLQKVSDSFLCIITWYIPSGEVVASRNKRFGRFA